jgi:hypothetical protein
MERPFSFQIPLPLKLMTDFSSSMDDPATLINNENSNIQTELNKSAFKMLQMHPIQVENFLGHEGEA